MFGPRALVGGTLAIDIAVVAESSGAVVEQDLTADSALRRHKKYRARVNFVIACRDRNRCCVLRPGYIFSVQEQAKREKGRYYKHRMERALASARADFWWTGKAAHCANVRPDRLTVCSPTMQRYMFAPRPCH